MLKIKTWKLWIVILTILTIAGASNVLIASAENNNEAAPSVQSTEVQKISPNFIQPPVDEGPPLYPNHPPIDQIPPMPMPETPGETVPQSVPGEGQGIFHNLKTGETTILPAISPLDELIENFGGGYNGTDGGVGTEMLPASFGAMSVISNVYDFPWRMNVKLVLRFGASWYVCSGTMRDAEVALTAGHCVYDTGTDSWADEIYVYPAYDGDTYPIGAYGYGTSVSLGSWTGWTVSHDWNYDIGIIAINRAVGMLTGWYGWACGGDCDWHLSTTYHNPSYPAEPCDEPGLHNGNDLYYWYGNWYSCPTWNRLALDTTPGCFTAVWGGMSGSGAYYIDDDNVRHVHAVCSTSDRAYWGEYTRQFCDWVDYNDNTFIPDYARGSAFDIQALDVNAEPATITAGQSTRLLNHLATNATNGSNTGTWTYRVYLSTNDNISESDTLLSTQFYSWTFNAMSSVRVNMVQVTIPANTPTGDYWIGLVYDSATDGDSSNNDTDGWDAVPIHVNGLPGVLSVTPADGLTSSGPQGGPFSPSNKVYTLSNTGGSSINWTASKGQTWVSLSGTSGTLAAGANTTVTVSINSNANSLAPGPYSDTVSFTNTTNGNGNTTRPVSLTVNPVLPNVSVTFKPDSTTIPRGGTLGYTVTVTNNTSSSQTFQYWTYVILPNGNRYPTTGELFGPVTVTLSAGQVRNAHLTLKIPATAPLGSYTYYGNVGPYPTVWDSDSFNFTVTSALAPGATEQQGWELLENNLK